MICVIEHVELVDDTRALVESLCEKLGYDIVNANDFHYSYVSKKTKSK